MHPFNGTMEHALPELPGDSHVTVDALNLYCQQRCHARHVQCLLHKAVDGDEVDADGTVKGVVAVRQHSLWEAFLDVQRIKSATSSVHVRP